MNLVMSSWGAYIVKEKLKRLKMKIKEWHEQHCGFLKKVEELAVSKIKELDGNDDLGKLALV